jgi:hypothetical protein
MSYVKKINGYIIKDEEARQEIANIKTNLTGAMHYIGASTTSLGNFKREGPWNIGGKIYNVESFYLSEGGSTRDFYTRDESQDLTIYPGFKAYYSGRETTFRQPQVVYVVKSESIESIDDIYCYSSGGDANPVKIHEYHSGVYANIVISDIHNLGENEIAPSYGSVATYEPEGKEEREYVYGPTGWEEFGSTGSLKALAFKDTANVSASGSCVPNGTNAPSAVTFQTPGELPYMSYDPENETLTFEQGSFPSGGVAAAQVFTGSNTSVNVSGTAS